MLIIIDDVLNTEKLKITQEYFNYPDNRKMQWVDGSLDECMSGGTPMADILAHVRCAFDLKYMSGAEQWAHYGTKPNWHIDKDETLVNTTGEIAMPICSIVFYADIHYLKGGKFMTNSVSVTPKTNRLIAFSPGVEHGVEDYTGTRMSIAINPWATKPRGY
jgi:hypothetical protein